MVNLSRSILIYIFLCVIQITCAEDLEAFKLIPDVCHPTLADLRLLQHSLSKEQRFVLKRLGDKEEVIRKFKIIGDSPDEEPIVFKADIGVAPMGEKENCVICYASYNERYPQGCKRLFSKIVESDFRGHLDFRIGGWPDLEGGSLILAPVPFAFKACFLKEMKKEGYKRVLWLDSSIVPVVSLNKIFQIIEERGYFIQKNSHTLHVPFVNEELAKSYELSFKEATDLYSCSAAIIGVDFSNERVSQLVDAWYEAAQHPLAFYSPRSDQTALSLLLHKFGLTDWFPFSTLGTAEKKIKKDVLFIMDRGYVK